MAPTETENNAYVKFGLTNKEHYGMLWYFLERSIVHQENTLILSHFRRMGENHLSLSRGKRIRIIGR